jgi:hypothetical protein
MPVLARLLPALDPRLRGDDGGERWDDGRNGGVKMENRRAPPASRASKPPKRKPPPRFRSGGFVFPIGKRVSA